jgi:hypothetical protein
MGCSQLSLVSFCSKQIVDLNRNSVLTMRHDPPPEKLLLFGLSTGVEHITGIFDLMSEQGEA